MSGPGLRRAAPITVRRLFWNTGLNYLTFVLVGLTGFVLTPVILGHVGASRMGMWTLSVSITAYASILDFGLGASLMRTISEQAAEPDRRNMSRLVSSMFGLYAVIGMVLLIVGLGATSAMESLFHIQPDLSEEFRWTFRLSVISVACCFPQSIFSAVIHGMRDYAIQNAFTLGYTAFTFTASIILLLNGYGIVALAVVTLVGMLGQFAGKAVIVYHRYGVQVRPRHMSHRHLRNLMGAAGAVFIINVSSKVIFDTDLVVVGALMGTAAVAAYQVALTIGTLLRRVAEQLNVVTLTTSSGLWAAGETERLGRLFLEAMRITALVMMPATAIVWVIGPHFLTLWVGADMSAASSTTLAVLCGAMVIVALHTTASQLLVAIHRHRLVATVAMIEAAANLLLSIVLGMRFGIVGVAVGTLFPTFVVLVLVSVGVTCRALNLSYWSVAKVIGFPLIQAVAFFVVARTFAMPFVESLGLISLIAVCGLVLGVWVATNLFLPRESRARYRQVLPSWGAGATRAPARGRAGQENRHTKDGAR